ncbi:MAG: L-fucose/L-arabinose isomerase family protein [Bacillota bacterium]|nr:L-fucose/L-arabinose isomerase family protein [Bacillota bacterium]
MEFIEPIKPPKKARIGLYTVGLKAYWAQFDGLHDRLVGYGKFIEQRLCEAGEVYNFGLVDDEEAGRRAGEWFNIHNVDIIFCHCATYCTSASVLPVHQICKAPSVILNLQPAPEMNYGKTSTGEWLAHCNACAVPELSNAFNRAHIPCRIVNGLLGLSETPSISAADEVTNERNESISAWNEILEWAKAAGVCRSLKHSRFGFLGGNYSGMLDMYSDFTLMQSSLGMHVELLEMCDLDKYLRNITDKEAEQKKKEIESFFMISGDSPSDPIAKRPSEEQLDWSSRVAAAQEKLVREYDLDALSYYYHGNDNYYEKVQSGFIVGHSLLTAAGIPCSGEGDMKTTVSMKICDILNTGGSFSEIVAADYNRGTIILGHDGPFHIALSDGKPVLRGMGIYHGKKGSGVSVEAQVRAGTVTTLGLTQTGEVKLKFIVSEGEAIKAPILMIGNTQTHIKFQAAPDRYYDSWFKEAPTHHCALSVGHNSGLFKKTSELLGIDSVIL